MEVVGAGEEAGRLDIVFNLLVPSEEIYFCLEGKRLNVVTDDGKRTYASEYVRLGMMRFVSGQYSRAVRHGGMIGYVLDHEIGRAIERVEANVRAQWDALGMTQPEGLGRSVVLGRTEERARESHHRRKNENGTFCIHHLFMAPRRG